MEVTPGTPCILNIGTNLGEKEANLLAAVQSISQNAKIKLLKSSRHYQSEPMGFQSENTFYNQAVLVSTQLSAKDLLTFLQEIERNMGRIQKSINNNYTDRIIDIDIIYYGNTRMETKELTLPHPFRLQRDFVLIPSAEICPEWIDCENFLTLSQLATHV